MDPSIDILPLFESEKELVNHLIRRLKKAFSCKVLCLKPVKTDLSYAYNAGRAQYNSTAILERIPSARNRGTRVLGIVDVDLFVPRLNFVFGEAHIGKGVCLISLTRLRQEFYGLKQDKALFLERAAKEAIHELGHTWGLSHCRNPGCVMFFSNSLLDTDRKSALFCPRCRNLLKLE